MPRNQHPSVVEHDGILVVRDDMFPGGTKARALSVLFRGVQEVVYATSAEGGAQYALAHVARKLKKKVTIFVARRSIMHPRTRQAQALGANIRLVEPPAFLTVVQARAREYAQRKGAFLVPFGGRDERVVQKLQLAAGMVRSHLLWLYGPQFRPDEVWCAASSGTLATALQWTFASSKHHVVQVGHKLTKEEVGSAKVHVDKRRYSQEGPPTPFPADPYYEAKAWEHCIAHRRKRGATVLFWNVTGYPGVG